MTCSGLSARERHKQAVIGWKYAVPWEGIGPAGAFFSQETNMLSRKTRPIYAFAGLAVLTTSGMPALAEGFDPTGTYEGFAACEFYEDGVSRFEKTPDILTVSVNPESGALDVYSDSIHMHYTGIRIDDAVNPDTEGRAGLLNCKTQTEPEWLSETAELEFIEIDATRATLIGRSVFLGTFGDLLPDSQGVMGHCQWRYRRVDATDPFVEHCPFGNFSFARFIRER